MVFLRPLDKVLLFDALGLYEQQLARDHFVQQPLGGLFEREIIVLHIRLRVLVHGLDQFALVDHFFLALEHQLALAVVFFDRIDNRHDLLGVFFVVMLDQSAARKHRTAQNDTKQYAHKLFIHR